MKTSSKSKIRISVKKSRPYTTKTGKLAQRKAHYRNVNKYPNTYIAYRMVNGEQRLCRITRKGNKEYVHIIDDYSKARPVSSKNAKKPEKQQEGDKRKTIKELEKHIDEGKLFVRWSDSIEDVSQPSFEIYDNVILDTVDTMDLGFGLQKVGLIPDEVEEGNEYDWEEYASVLLEKARKGDKDAQKDALEGYIYDKDLPYDVSERIIDGKREVGLEANGVNVGSGAGMGVPTGLRYYCYLKGEIIGDNLQNDGFVLNIDKIIAIYDEKLNKFVKLDIEEI